MHTKRYAQKTAHSKFLWAIVFTLMSTQALAENQFLRGDANGDGVIDISDAVTTLQYLFNCGDDCPMICDDAADYDDNGVIEMADAIQTFSFLFQGGAAPQAPYPDVGDDSTEDTLRCGSAATVLKVAAGKHHSCAITDAGETFCWGANNYGQLGDGTREDRILPSLASLEAAADEIVTGYGRHTCARVGGRVWCYGEGGKGQLGNGNTLISDVPVAVADITDATQLSIGEKHSCSLLADGTVHCWGWNKNGQLGDGTETDRSTPAAVSGLSGIVSIASGSHHNCALAEDGSVSCWGRAAWSALGHGSRYDDALIPSTVEGLSTVTTLAAGGNHNCVITTEGSTWCWGAARQGQCGSGLPMAYRRPNPVQVANLPAIESLSLGLSHSCGLTEEGAAWCWGWNNYGQLGDGNTTSTSEPQLVTNAQGSVFVHDIDVIVSLSAGSHHTCAITSTQGLWCWGANADAQLGDNTTEHRVLPVRIEIPGEQVNEEIYIWTQLDSGGSHTCALADDGRVACWGSDQNGQSTVPDELFSEISSGKKHSCAIKQDGQLLCWGDDEYGKATPPIGTFTNVSAGDHHSCGVDINGDVHCWGWNYLGQSNPPEGNFISVNVGNQHTCGLKTDASVACWGWDVYGQSTPPSTHFSQITSGNGHSCGLGNDSTITCWGNNEGDETDYGQVSDTPDGVFENVSAGQSHNCAVELGGSVICWGKDFYEQSTPPDGTFLSISGGHYHTCGIKTDGSLECWGRDNLGQSTPPQSVQE